MAPLTKLPLFFLILLSYFTQLITHSLATTLPHNADHNTTIAHGDDITLCRDFDTWIRPSWPRDMYFICEALINDLYTSQPDMEMISPPLHEFLPEGLPRHWPGLGGPVRTPWRLRKGGYGLI